MPLDPVSAVSRSAPSGLDLAGYGAPAPKPSADELAKAAKQFEAIMVRQLLAPAIEPIMNGGSLGGDDEAAGSGGGGIYGYMLTDVLANSLTEGGGLGLAPVITRQLTPAAARAAQP